MSRILIWNLVIWSCLQASAEVVFSPEEHDSMELPRKWVKRKSEVTEFYSTLKIGPRAQDEVNVIIVGILSEKHRSARAEAAFQNEYRRKVGEVHAYDESVFDGRKAYRVRCSDVHRYCDWYFVESRAGAKYRYHIFYSAPNKKLHRKYLKQAQLVLSSVKLGSVEALKRE